MVSYSNKEDGDDHGGWEGNITTLKNHFSSQIATVTRAIEKSTQRLEGKHV